MGKHINKIKNTALLIAENEHNLEILFKDNTIACPAPYWGVVAYGTFGAAMPGCAIAVAGEE